MSRIGMIVVVDLLTVTIEDASAATLAVCPPVSAALLSTPLYPLARFRYVPSVVFH